jgi:hypothetical protein
MGDLLGLVMLFNVSGIVPTGSMEFSSTTQTILRFVSSSKYVGSRTDLCRLLCRRSPGN